MESTINQQNFCLLRGRNNIDFLEWKNSSNNILKGMFKKAQPP